MSRFVKFFVCAFAVVAIAGVAQAATVDLWLTTYQDLDDDSSNDLFTLEATASQGDNGGIAGYNIDLVNITGALSLGPKAFNLDNFTNMGFTVGNTDLNGDGALFAGQNSTDQASILYGIGQTAGTIESFAPGSETNVPWDAKILLASGTGDWREVDIAVSANVNVWSGSTGTDAQSADVNINVDRNVIPEPASFALLGIALLGIVALRRKLG